VAKRPMILRILGGTISHITALCILWHYTGSERDIFTLPKCVNFNFEFQKMGQCLRPYDGEATALLQKITPSQPQYCLEAMRRKRSAWP